MKKYSLKRPLKTRILNSLRSMFTNTAFEKIIVNKTTKDLSFNPKGFDVWKKLIPPNYLYSKNSKRTVIRSGIKYDLDISNVLDHYIYFGLKNSNYDAVNGAVSKAKVIFDVGANIGHTALKFASFNPRSVVYGFEPHPKTFKRALNNIDLNGFNNIHFHNIGLGDKAGFLRMYEVNPNNIGMNRILEGEHEFPFVDVEVATIDQFVKKLGISSIDFMKIDVEGFEYAVLKGAEESLKKSKPVLFIELDDNYLRENGVSALGLMDLLLFYGYTSFMKADNLQNINREYNFKNCHFDMVAS